MMPLIDMLYPSLKPVGAITIGGRLCYLLMGVIIFFGIIQFLLTNGSLKLVKCNIIEPKSTVMLSNTNKSLELFPIIKPNSKNNTNANNTNNNNNNNNNNDNDEISLLRKLLL